MKSISCVARRQCNGFNDLWFGWRLLFVFLSLFIIFFAWRFFWGEEIYQQKSRLIKVQYQMLSDYSDKQKSIDLMKNGSEFLEVDSLGERVMDLQKKLDRLDAEMKYFSSPAVASENLVKMIRDVASHRKDIDIERLLVLPKRVVSPQGMLGVNGLDGDNIENLTIYKQGLNLRLSGSFADIVAYLQMLEGLQWNFFWDEMIYKADKYPGASIDLSIYTLVVAEGLFSG